MPKRPLGLLLPTHLLQRDYFTMFGFDYDAKASAQVASFNFPKAPQTFYTLGDYCSVDNPITLSPGDAWPTEIPTAQPFDPVDPELPYHLFLPLVIQ
jgi:hypothetical protein